MEIRRIKGRGITQLWPRESYNGDPHIEITARFNTERFWRAWRLSTFFGGDDCQLSAHAAAGPVALGIALKKIYPYKLAQHSYRVWAKKLAEEAERRGLGKTYEHEVDPLGGRIPFEISIHSGSVWINLWNSGQGWSRQANSVPPWLSYGWAWTLPVTDWITGERDYQSDENKQREVSAMVPMPEGGYRCTVTVFRVRWVRKRWPFGRRWVWRYRVEVPGGIPMPGKGSMAYNCGEDASYGVTSEIFDHKPTVWDAVCSVAASVLNWRKKYGGDGWLPGLGKWVHCNRCEAVANNGYAVAETFRGDPTAWACLTCQPVKPRWRVLSDKTTNSGKALFRCVECSRESCTPDKVCPAGCGTEKQPEQQEAKA